MQDSMNGERGRQRALDACRIVDTLPETAYDEIVRLASHICDVPVSLVSLVDRDRQWFKARLGVDAQQTPREFAFCDHAIRTPGELMEVPDATRDPRFAGNPLVTGHPDIRFYAGMPLVTPQGEAIGTVCVIDRIPRTLSAGQREALASLARLTMELLQARARELVHARAGAGQRIGAQHGNNGGGLHVAIVQLQDQPGSVARGNGEMDRAMQRLEQCIRGCVRADDVVSRHGSHEFIVLLTGGDIEASATEQALFDGLLRLEHDAGIPVSVGTARARDPREPMEDVFLRADEALALGKDTPRQPPLPA